MKKFIIVIINVIVIFIFIFIAEYIARGIHLKNFNPAIMKKNVQDMAVWINMDTSDGNAFFMEDGQEILTFREPFQKKFPSNNSIMLAGCSFTYGCLLNYDDTFSSVLYNYAHRNVYNVGMNGASPRDFLYILRNKHILDRVVNIDKNEKIKYIIYTYIDDQKPRLFSNAYAKSPSFKWRKGKLIYHKQNPILLKSLLYLKLSKFVAYNLIPLSIQYKVLNTYFKEINKEIKKIYGEDTQFIILVYMNDNNNWEELKKEGIRIIFLNDIVSMDPLSPEYTVKDGLHPNRKAWEIIVPELSKELNL